MSAPEIMDAAGAAALVDVEQGLASRRLFVDEALFELEAERIFTRAWLFVGLESEIPQPGDYVTRNMGLDPVILVRGEDGRPRVLHNSCPHRGVMICQADAGRVPAFRTRTGPWAASCSWDQRVWARPN